MRQVLFRIPLDQPWSLGPLGEVPGFGFGLLLALWVLFGLWWVVRHRSELAPRAEWLVPIALWIAGAAAIILVPHAVRRDSNQAIAAHTAAIERLGSSSRAAPHLVERALAQYAHREYAAALADLRRAVEVGPGYGPAHWQLAWLLATAPETEFRDGDEAVREAARAAELSGSPTPTHLDISAAALAESGDYEAAAARAGRAARMALESEDDEEKARLSDIRRRLWTYTQDSPWYEEPPGKTLPIYGYGFMLFLGFVAAGWDASRRAARVGIAPQAIWDFAMWMLAAGVVGARLFYVVQYHEKVFRNADTLGEQLIAIVSLPDGGLVLLGGITLAVIVAYIFCGVKRISRPLLGDVVMPSLVLGIAFGRLGCLMNGCCWGDACQLPWAIRFPVGSVPDSAMVARGLTAAGDPNVLLLHPTQIYSAVSAFILFIFLATLFWYRRRDGIVLATAMLLYSVGRFLIEYVRSDEALVELKLRTFGLWGDVLWSTPTPFTISQWISIGLFLGGCVYLTYLLWRPREVTRPRRLSAGASGPPAPSHANGPVAT